MDDGERRRKAERFIYLAQFAWSRFARPEQLAPPGDWLVWLILAGRGYGKTRTGAEWVKDQALGIPGSRWAVVARTIADARDVCIEGESGLLSCLPDDRVRNWNRSMGELDLVNGSRIKTYSSEKPEALKGPQHHGAWCDELAAWIYPETWDDLQFGLRLGEMPRTVVTTTPRPTALIRDLMARETVHVTRGSTFDNADNLSAAALVELKHRYEGTRLGRQELYGEVLEDVEGALWTLAEIDASRAAEMENDLVRVVTAIDPAVTSGEESDETGIVTAGVSEAGWCPVCGPIVDGPHAVVLADDTVRSSPDAWCRRAIDALRQNDGDRIIGEVNNGGDLIETVLRTVDPSVPYRKVTATRGKRLRAEPVAALYEQGRVHHLGSFAALEDQMCSWTIDSKTSPDRLDALVWALTDLMLVEQVAKRRGILVR